VASQTLWQHGPAALALLLTFSLLFDRPATRTRLVVAGLTTAALVAFRSIDVLFALTFVAWLARHQLRGLLWFLPAPLVGAGVLLAYNCYYFGTIEGGQARLEAMHPELHGVPGAWAGHVIE